jgi:hypothetical protein
MHFHHPQGWTFAQIICGVPLETKSFVPFETLGSLGYTKTAAHFPFFIFLKPQSFNVLQKMKLAVFSFSWFEQNPFAPAGTNKPTQLCQIVFLKGTKCVRTRLTHYRPRDDCRYQQSAKD